MAGKIQLKFVLVVPYPEGVSAAKLISFRSGSTELRMRETAFSWFL